MLGEQEGLEVLGYVHTNLVSMMSSVPASADEVTQRIAQSVKAQSKDRYMRSSDQLTSKLSSGMGMGWAGTGGTKGRRF